MKNYRTYGVEPFSVAVIHGGPGAAGSLKTLAQQLLKFCGILEPLQTADSVTGQVKELRKTLEQHAELPVILIGHSWGAMLGYLLAAYYPHLVKKLIMVASGVFDANYAKSIMETRLSRLSPDQKNQLNEMISKLKEDSNHFDELFFQFGKLIEKADAYDPIQSDEYEMMPGQHHIYQSVWPIAAKIRESGELLSLGKNIICPVVAIHGDYDPHPYQGVKEPLSKVIKNFSFILLEKCGHELWIERHARENFFEIIKKNLME